VNLNQFGLDGREIIYLRGYPEESISGSGGAPLVAKYTAELRYPLSTNPQATIYTLAFAEAGNTWDTFKEFNPFQVKRSAGIGLRVFLPMFGLLGLDYGWRFDPLAPEQGGDLIEKNQLHFSIGMNIGDL
jgi:outer membrane protein insertion porin family